MLNKSFVVLLEILGLLSIAVVAQAPYNQWRGLVPLRSTRVDVERMLGKPIDKKLNLYETEHERVTVWFSSGTCKDIGVQWNVPVETVLQILVAPKQLLTIAQLKVDISKPLTKEVDMRVRDTNLYYTKDKAIKFQTRVRDGVEDVVFIAYAPTNGDEKLRCKQAP